MVDHFDTLDDYDAEIPSHLRQYYLERKCGRLLAELETLGPSSRVLDVGCGTGWHVARLVERGHRAYGVDRSIRQVETARRHCAEASFAVADAVALPFPDASFDLVYTINTLHHVGPPDVQAAAVGEMLRVLRPGGKLTVFEINLRNPLMQVYMNYLFPKLRSIDTGDEYWIHPHHWRNRYPAEKPVVSYFTFVPDFTPSLLLPMMQGVEAVLERTPLLPWSAHYAATLTRR